MYKNHELRTVMTRSPLRVSFTGGGTDFPEYYRNFGGHFVSTALNRFIYCVVKDHSISFNEKFRLNYSETELVSDLNDIQNGIMRAALSRFEERTGTVPRLYVSTIGDLRSNSGLGSSSAFACALLLALSRFEETPLLPDELAKQAVELEIGFLKKPIGIQDQFASAFGGLRAYEITKFGDVTSRSITLNPAARQSLNDCLILVDTGISRNADDILKHQATPSKLQENLLNLIQEESRNFENELGKDVDGSLPGLLAETLNRSWAIKKQISAEIANSNIVDKFDSLMALGCLGGKISGAGGGGYFLMVVDPNERERICAEMKDRRLLYDLPQVSTLGSEVLVNC